MSSSKIIDRPCVVYVPHGPERERKMVGKVFEHSTRGLCFLHAMSGNQYHLKHRCPSPIDVGVAAALALGGIEWYYAYDRKKAILWRINIDAVRESQIHEYDGRIRFYPAEESWSKQVMVNERQDGRYTQYSVGAQPVIRVPFYVGPEYDLVLDHMTF